MASAVLRDAIWSVLVRREVSHRLETSDLEGLPEPVCELMPPVGVLTRERTNSLQVPDPQAMSMNTVVSLLLATQEQQSAVLESAHVCNGRHAHNSSDYGRDHHH